MHKNSSNFRLWSLSWDSHTPNFIIPPCIKALLLIADSGKNNFSRYRIIPLLYTTQPMIFLQSLRSSFKKLFLQSRLEKHYEPYPLQNQFQRDSRGRGVSVALEERIHQYATFPSKSPCRMHLRIEKTMFLKFTLHNTRIMSNWQYGHLGLLSSPYSMCKV